MTTENVVQLTKLREAEGGEGKYGKIINWVLIVPLGCLKRWTEMLLAAGNVGQDCRREM